MSLFVWVIPFLQGLGAGAERWDVFGVASLAAIIGSVERVVDGFPEASVEVYAIATVIGISYLIATFSIGYLIGQKFFKEVSS